MTKALLLLVLVPGLAALAPAASGGDTHEPRVEVAGYVAGTGDLGCVVTGLGCLRFSVQGHESQVTVTLDDEVLDPVAMDVCSPDCGGATGSFCGSGTVTGLKPGDQVFVFVNVATGTDQCWPALGAGFRGEATAVFT